MMIETMAKTKNEKHKTHEVAVKDIIIKRRTTTTSGYSFF